MQIYFIRHGQSINNANWNTPGYIESSDPILTEIGIAQAGIIAEHIATSQPLTPGVDWNPLNRHGYGITHIYASLMERAVHTGAHIARKLPGVPFTAWEELHESGGIYGRDGEKKARGLPGKPRSWYEANFPEFALPAHLDESGWWRERPQETEEECQIRAQRVWAELLARHGDRPDQPEERIALVSHGGFFVHFLCAMLNLPWRNAANGMKSWFLLHNCSLSRIDVRKGEVTLCYQNRTDYFANDLVTG